MTKQKINRFITEKVMGECWHEIDDRYAGDVLPNPYTLHKCKHCGVIFADMINTDGYITNHDYCTDWTAFGRLWEKMRESDDYEKLNLGIEWPNEICVAYINPTRFAEAVARFYGWKE